MSDNLVPEAWGIGVGDFNEDGIPDLAVASDVPSGGVTILTGDGTGAFHPVGSLHVTGDLPSVLIVADLNNDGHQDVAVANTADNNVAVLLGDGTGAMTPDSLGPFIVGYSPATLVAGDFNGDGNLDLATGNAAPNPPTSSTVTYSLTMLLGNGASGFSPAPYSPITVGGQPYIATGDFNGDGFLDLVANNYLDNTFDVLLGTSGLTISATAGALKVGQPGFFTVVVTNQGAATSSGLVTVTDTLPAGLTLVTASGDGWSCPTGQTVSCTRSDGLGAGQSYSPISLVVDVTGSACPAAGNSVTLTHGSRAAAGGPAPISGCLNVSQSVRGLIVGSTGVYTLQVQSVPGANISGVTITDVLPSGLTLISASGSWLCTGLPLTCTYSGPPSGVGYPDLSIKVTVGIGVCPKAINLIQVQAAGGSMDTVVPAAAPVSGCLTFENVTLQNVTFAPAVLNSAQVQVITVLSTSAQVETIQYPNIVNNGGVNWFSVGSNTCALLIPGNSCSIAVVSNNPCAGTATGTLTVSTASGASFPFSISATSNPSTLSLTLDGKTLSTSTLSPYTTHVIGLTMTPQQQSICPQQVGLSLGFTPLNADQGYSADTYDTGYSGGMLTTGTVAGTFQLQAEVGTGASAVKVTAPGQSGLFQLTVPALSGTVQTLMVTNPTSSSFQVNITGYSTPRGNGNASNAANAIAGTEMCVAFLGSSGATVTDDAATCALDQDMEIWYQRNVSYAYGSRFSAGLIFPYSGSVSAIATVEAWVRNEEGDGTPMCVNFKTGATVSCPN